MNLFRAVQFTTVFTGIVNIATQGQYIESRPFEAINYFFYSNIAIQAGKTIVSCFAYCILATKLRSSATADISGVDQSFGIAKDGKNATTTIEDGGGNSGAIQLVDMVPNPLQSSQNNRTNTRFELAAANNDALEALQKKFGDMDRSMQEQQKEHTRLQEQYEQQKREMECERARNEAERQRSAERQVEFARDLELLRKHVQQASTGTGKDAEDAPAREAEK
jgi:hypothetical protein